MIWIFGEVRIVPPLLTTSGGSSPSEPMPPAPVPVVPVLAVVVVLLVAAPLPPAPPGPVAVEPPVPGVPVVLELPPPHAATHAAARIAPPSRAVLETSMVGLLRGLSGPASRIKAERRSGRHGQECAETRQAPLERRAVRGPTGKMRLRYPCRATRPYARLW